MRKLRREKKRAKQEWQRAREKIAEDDNPLQIMLDVQDRKHIDGHAMKVVIFNYVAILIKLNQINDRLWNILDFQNLEPVGSHLCSND